MRIDLYAGPSHASWAWANEIVAQAVSRGWYVISRDPDIPATPGRPDWVLSSVADAEEEGLAIIMGPDFAAADLGRMDISQLAEHFSHRPVPCAFGTRWFASASVAAAEGVGNTLLISAEKTALDLDGLWPSERPADLGELRAVDPALGIYGSRLSPGARAFWSPALFATATQGEASNASNWVNITGRAKSVADDPNMSLVAGSWSVEWLIEVNPEGGVVDLLFQWGDQELHEVVRRPGRYSITQSAQWVVGGHARARIQSLRPHFQGKARLVGAVVTRLAQAAHSSPQAARPPVKS